MPPWARAVVPPLTGPVAPLLTGPVAPLLMGPVESPLMGPVESPLIGAVESPLIGAVELRLRKGGIPRDEVQRKRRDAGNLRPTEKGRARVRTGAQSPAYLGPWDHRRKPRGAEGRKADRNARKGRRALPGSALP